MKRQPTDRATGIIRTLPYFGSKDSERGKGAMNLAYRRMMTALKNLENDKTDEAEVWVAFPTKPTQEVLYCYLNVGGHIRVRANISHWVDGKNRMAVRCWDDSFRQAKWWAVLTGPVSWPPHSIAMRGTQGFRYTENLW